MNTEMTTRETELLAANAALELEVVRLRGALRETTVALEHRWEVVANRAAPIMESVIDAAHTKGIEALSTPFTPQALTELIEKVEKMTIERCAEAVWSQYVNVPKLIRALPTGQIKLEELL